MMAPSNKKMQRTKHGLDRALPLIFVFYGPLGMRVERIDVAVA
jgi:hypothetical protein